MGNSRSRSKKSNEFIKPVETKNNEDLYVKKKLEQEKRADEVYKRVIEKRYEEYYRLINANENTINKFIESHDSCQLNKIEDIDRRKSIVENCKDHYESIMYTPICLETFEQDYKEYSQIVIDLYNRLGITQIKFTITMRENKVSWSSISQRDVYIHSFFEKLLDSNPLFLKKYNIFIVRNNFYKTQKIVFDGNSEVIYTQPTDKEEIIVEAYIKNNVPILEKYLIPDFDYIYNPQ